MKKLKKYEPFHYFIFVFLLLALLSSMVGCSKSGEENVARIRVFKERQAKPIEGEHIDGYNFDVEVYDNMRYLLITNTNRQVGSSVSVINLTKDSLECAVFRNAMK